MTSGVRYTIDDARKVFAKYDWTVQSTEYVNSKGRLDCTCPNGHPHKRSIDSFRASPKCGDCIRESKRREMIKMIASELEKINWKLESTEYEGPHKKLKMICRGDHALDLSWSDFYHEGVRCKICDRRSTRSQRSEEEVRSVEITNAMRIDLCKHLGRKYPFVTTVFCGKLALQIIEKLGPRPSSDHHIDHIISPSWFNHNKEEQRLLCWNVNNVRWLLGGLNSSKYNYLPEDLIADLTPYQICVANLAEWRSAEHEDLMKRNGIWMSKQTALERLSRLGEEESLIAYKIVTLSSNQIFPKQA